MVTVLLVIELLQTENRCFMICCIPPGNLNIKQCLSTNKVTRM